MGTREGQVAPLIEGALGWIEAETLTEADAGDHTFFIADILDQGAAIAASASQSLCFANLSRMASYMTMFLLIQALTASVSSAE